METSGEDGSAINHSELFSQLVNKDGQMNDTVASFLYYMFPRELFIRALSLIESCNMFIYVLVPSGVNDKNNQPLKFLEVSDLVNSIYDDSELHRLIVKPSDEDVPTYVDLNNWMCSCQEYTDLMLERLNQMEAGSLASSLLKDIDDSQRFQEDRFAQLDAHSLSMQRYVHCEKLNCPHLLAYSILLRSSTRTLQHFLEKGQILLIQINNMDEWLKLHINVVE
ncbi:hypothetical protein ZYGR_0H03040 [Zygosaccharomyces rouxii]|uniref:Suppressor of hydroxyurea sensitivity protein 2 n=2 Tax=Zygosaccharomyces rouxii TaxID=4956 RepID=SHU2_ZYGRC|nr:uncharacterized protein ZYRO0B11066g [Zygosaccharomyces rouxii]C5DRT0.1 RecName: Full=Suppressor of hydroxyurea sensitivity protein 2 [Zygosaccharomyces rouxii CBS 732]GAV47461.1 hypothetical protein ZYGR_0H03040 [Zygosaccharomyces rouxii]CAR26491.1 ZYRO0B11066p [Zygosaccharomyces rouxii]